MERKLASFLGWCLLIVGLLVVSTGYQLLGCAGIVLGMILLCLTLE